MSPIAVSSLSREEILRLRDKISRREELTPSERLQLLRTLAEGDATKLRALGLSIPSVRVTPRQTTSASVSPEQSAAPYIAREGDIGVSGDRRIWRKENGTVVDTGKRIRRYQYLHTYDWGLYGVDKNDIVFHCSPDVLMSVFWNFVACFVVFLVVLCLGIYAFLKFV